MINQITDGAVRVADACFENRRNVLVEKLYVNIKIVLQFS